jgi:hypothetical protein
VKGKENELKLSVADDDPITREIIEILLIKQGYDVSLACDGNGSKAVFFCRYRKLLTLSAVPFSKI